MCFDCLALQFRLSKVGSLAWVLVRRVEFDCQCFESDQSFADRLLLLRDTSPTSLQARESEWVFLYLRAWSGWCVWVIR